MQVASSFPPWEDLLPDTLANIFLRLSFEENLNVVPAICKNWHQTVNGPRCWQEIEIEEWSRDHPEHVDGMVEKLVTRSGDSLKKLCVYGVQSERVLNLIAIK